MFKSLYSKIISSIFIIGTLLILSIYILLYFINIEASENFNERKMDIWINIVKEEKLSKSQLESFLKATALKDPFIKEIKINNLIIKGKGYKKRILFKRKYKILNNKIIIEYIYSAINRYVRALQIRMSIVAIAFYFLLFLISELIKKMLYPFNDIIYFFQEFEINKKKKLTFKKQVAIEFQYVQISINKMINNLEKFKKEIKFLAYNDQLTKLPNRNAYTLLLKENKYSLLFLDLDNFKLINNTFGHEIGDKVLSEISNRLNVLKRDKMKIFRIGGDEFIIILDTVDKTYINEFCELVKKELYKDIEVKEQILNMSTSIGISIVENKEKDSLKEADIAMYEAKNKGKNKHIFFEKEMEKEIKNKLKLIRDIKLSTKEENFIFFLQPKINIKDNKIYGAEALIRWNINGKLINPIHFIKILESSKYMYEVGNQIIEKVFYFSKEFSEIIFSINLAEKQINNENFIIDIIELIKKTKVNPKQIEWEILERWKSIEDKIVINNLNSLKNLGFSLSIDDFGEDNSSFKRTDTLPISEIKIDKNFADRIYQKPSSLGAIKAIKLYAEMTNKTIVVEGIETKEQVEELKKLGIKYVQGYYFFKPMEQNEFKKLFRGQKTKIEKRP